jgi:hypothetical protein
LQRRAPSGGHHPAYWQHPSAAAVYSIPILNTCIF